MAIYIAKEFCFLLFICAFWNNCYSSIANDLNVFSLEGFLGHDDQVLTKAILHLVVQAVQPLRDEIAHLKTEISDIRASHVDELKKVDPQSLREEIAFLKTEISDMRASHVEELRNIRSEVEYQLSVLVDKCEVDAEKSVNELKNKSLRIVNQTDDISTYKGNCTKDELNRKIQNDLLSRRAAGIRRQSSHLRVAFFAKKTSATLHLGIGQHIVFDNAVTNIGNAYDSNIGVFKVPVSGVYLITTSLTTYSRSNGHFAIFINQKQETWFYLNGAENQWDETSQTIIVHLDVGDDITVRSFLDVDHGVHGDDHSIFAGTLLFMDEEQPSIIGK